MGTSCFWHASQSDPTGRVAQCRNLHTIHYMEEWGQTQSPQHPGKAAGRAHRPHTAGNRPWEMPPTAKYPRERTKKWRIAIKKLRLRWGAVYAATPWREEHNAVFRVADLQLEAVSPGFSIKRGPKDVRRKCRAPGRSSSPSAPPFLRTFVGPRLHCVCL